MTAKIGEVLINHKPHSFLTLFDYLLDYPDLYIKAAELMQEYNLLPNDALIIGICLHHKVKHIASFDKNDLQKVVFSKKLCSSFCTSSLIKRESRENMFLVSQKK